ncbi:MAG: hypothetical protein HZC54_05255 [Verrucomicrobia bacterium]|nr:hypothetical protein [Verrucomicrobiota bacterium]
MNADKTKKLGRSLIALAEQALREAVAEVVESHRQSGHPLVVWRNGRVERVYPSALLVREKPDKPYGQ